MKKYREQIEKFVPTCEQEKEDKKLILECIDIYQDKILTRETKIAHLTASGLILNHDFTKILMVYHNIYHSWSWTGGHVDGNFDLFEVALKEAKEEVGVNNLKAFSKDMISLEILPVYGHIKREQYVSCHLHLNVTYVFIADENEKTKAKEDENSGVMWIKESELEKYCSETEMIPVYRKIIHSALKIKKERQ
ncbi:MAG TPA: NUDIX hydrolase [Bacilli bacterium]|jgi:ADP-ribose pyrophosphatase YjhB (NUDIX family)|nr:NUDIX hydrolase [Bacilli bacterium]HOD61465.1 NUDIX hydrolase [Bacilli bacterium]HOH61485.1 NUDIX hydrolase [Bacilli bacterium]HPM14383.1 NUDIX hydrolase [Bacilli bacterium]HPY54430.1 NUDIX hydrolase [Bacilli bacterium]